MRRGLISWSRDEVPPSVLEGRVARLQEQMRNAGLGAMLIYTSFARPSAVAWLTHFVPYWNEALLVVLQTGAPVLLAAFSKRVHDWIRSVSHVGEVRSAPDLGRAAAAFLKERPPEPSRIGVLELDALPWPVAEPLVRSEYGALVDATDLFAAIRQPADEVEIQLARHAATIAAQAFKAIPTAAKRASELLSALEGSARLAGAEEVLPRLAPDLRTNATLRRLEGDALLGERYAVELSVAYKATWVRITRCVSTQAVPPSWRGAADRFVETAERLNEANLSLEPQVADRVRPGKTAAVWTLETCRGSAPLSIVTTGEAPSPSVLPGGSLASLFMQLELDDGPWLGGAPLILGSRGQPSRVLI